MIDQFPRPAPHVFDKSMSLHHDAGKYLAGGVSSNFRLNERPATMYFDRAEGAHLYSADGARYIDYALGMGPVILGHADRHVNQAVAESLAKGQLYAGQHQAETELAKLICDIVPCAEQVRFNLSGSEAIQAAFRVARAATGRQKIVKFEGHYHGWFDNIYASVHPVEMSETAQPESEGQDVSASANLTVLPWNDLEAVAGVLSRGDVAGVIMESVMCNTSVIFAEPGYLEGVRELCTKYGTVLIFDEVITGFRLSLGGAQLFHGVIPDLAVFAKALANGFPGSCLAGKASLMQLIGSGRVMHGGTYNSNVVCTAAAIATIQQLQRTDAYRRIHDAGDALIDGLRSLARQAQIPFLIQGTGAVFHTSFTSALAIRNYRENLQSDGRKLTAFLEALVVNGVRVTRRGTWFLSAAHTAADVSETLDAAQKAFAAVR